MNEITYVDQSRNFGAKTGLESNTGDRSTINMLHNPYNPKNTTIFYSNIMRTPDEFDLIDTSEYMNPYQDGHIVLVKVGEDGNATFLWNEGDLMLYSNCGGELKEHKFELN